VAFAGELGWSACGLELLRREIDGPKIALARHRSPRPPYQQGPAAAQAGATAMLDVSDGLLADLGHIAEESGVAVDLDPAAFPLDPQLRETAAQLGLDPLSWILTGGEDHALAATFPPEAEFPAGWTVVGRVRERAAADAPLVTVSGRVWAGAAGWDHFS
jgi:thiamine-monophosphate kinase